MVFVKYILLRLSIVKKANDCLKTLRGLLLAKLSMCVLHIKLIKYRKDDKVRNCKHSDKKIKIHFSIKVF